MHYAKVFDTIIHSSIWAEPSDTRVLWITMLVMSDRDGVIQASTSGLARAANITLESCKAALSILEAPDIDSKDKDYGGRRVERLDSGGWKVLNKAKYRDLQTPEQAGWAERQRRHRESKEGGSHVTSRDPSSTSVSGSTQIKNADEASRDVTAIDAMAELRRIAAESKAAATRSGSAPAVTS